MGYSINQKVRAQFSGHSFTGVVTGIQGTVVIVRPDVWEDWMTEHYSPNLDPEGCLVMHGSAVQAVSE